MLDAQSKAQLCASVAYDAKAENITILDVRDISQITDYFVIASGDNSRMLKGAARKIVVELRSRQECPYGTEGLESADWILLDYSDVIVHLLDEELREFYGLERLWGDAPQVDWTPSASPEEPGEA